MRPLVSGTYQDIINRTDCSPPAGIDSGSAREKLDALIDLTNRLE